MKPKKNISILPKITLILIQESKKRHIHPSIRKTQYFLKNKAKHYLKNGDFITFRVTYEDNSQNCGSYNKIEDLMWAFNAFVKEYLK